MTRRDGEADRVRRMSEQDTRDYLRRGNLTFLECAISLLVANMGTEAVAEILRDEAAQLEEYG